MSLKKNIEFKNKFLQINNYMKIRTKKEEKQSLLFNKKKYLILIFSIFLLFIGFLLLSGRGASDSTFNPEIFSSRRISYCTNCNYHCFYYFWIFYNDKKMTNLIDYIFYNNTRCNRVLPVVVVVI